MITEPIQIEQVVRITAAILAIHAIVTALELLATRQYHADGLLSWKISRLHTESYVIGQRLAPLLDQSRYRVIIFIKFATGIALLTATIVNTLHPLLLALLVLTYGSMYLRHHVGHTGDVDMALVVSSGLFIGTLSPGSHIETVAVLFVGAQGVLSYFIAGVSKLSSSSWRSGEAIESIFATRSWGNRWVFQVIERVPVLSIIISWLIIGFETVFVITPIVPFSAAAVLIAVAFVFHLFNAILMGLNRFLIAFSATYPSILFMNYFIRVSM